MGLSARASVGVLAFNCAEWFYSAMGAIHAGGVIAGIYTTNSADAVFHVLKDSHAEIVVVDDAKQMDKIHEIKDKLPKLKAAIQIQEPYAPYMKKEDGYYRVSLKKNNRISKPQNCKFIFFPFSLTAVV